MASTQSSWQWDDDRKKYYYYSFEAKSWIYEDGERISAASTTAEATSGNMAQIPGNYSAVQGAEASSEFSLTYLALQRSDNFSVIQDAEVSPDSLFSCPQLHYIADTEKERISPLVCQHLFEPKSTCSEPWEHTHIEAYGSIYGNGPSLFLCQYHDKDRQALLIDLGSAEIDEWELNSTLTEATQNYQSFMSKQLTQSNMHLSSWDEFYAAELRQYTWLRVNNKKISEEGYQISDTYFVSGITCSHCERWTKLGRYCGRCSTPLKNKINCSASKAREVEIFESIVQAESVREVIGGGVGGLTLGLVAGSYLLLSMLAV